MGSSPILLLTLGVNVLDKYAVQLVNISKSFPGVQALKDVTFTLKEGEVKALVGENGAGKSTLIKILTGAYVPDKGEIYVFGKKVERMTPIISENLGISAVYQNLVLAPHLTVAENIVLGSEPRKMRIFVNKSKMLEKARKVLAEVGYENIIDPNEKLGNLPVAQQGIVAIARALSRKAKVVIFDEPTAVLAKRETEELFRIIKDLKERGVSVIYISHRLEEIFEICDTVYVSKDGKFVGEMPVSETDEDKLISMMVGRKLRKEIYAKRNIGNVVLEVENIKNKKLKGCSFFMREGEIVGLYGLVGSGRTELARAIFGADPIEEGKIQMEGKPVHVKSPSHAIKASLALVPEDRRRHGLALKLSVRDNINLPIYKHISRLSVINHFMERSIANDFVKKLRIKTPSISTIVMHLSGGNQQKVVIAKWLASKSKIFIMDEPTNGIDVGAKEEIYHLMNELASEGAAILFISSYMPELMGICDRILVMRDGKIVGDVPREEMTEEKLLTLAIKEKNGEVSVNE